MFTLKVLGGASLDGPDGPVTGRAAQRRRLAVLALLAMTRRGSIAREKLIAVLWPDGEADRARHLLSDAIYVLNRALGDAIETVSDELRLRTDRLTCDARAFERALEAGELEHALQLYSGPFLEGFFIDGSEEFERWSAGERERLAGLYAAAVERAAEAAESRLEHRAALDHWRRLAREDLCNSRVAVRVARAMAAIGDRAGAMQHLQQHTTIVRRELGVTPSPDVPALVRELSAGPPIGAPVFEAVASPIVGPPSNETAVAAADAEDATRDLSVVDSPAPAAVRARGGYAAPYESRRHGRSTPLVAAVAMVLLAAAIAGVRSWQAPRATGVDAAVLSSIAVLPFADLSPGRDREYLSDGIAEELGSRLARVPGLRVAARTSAFTFKERDVDAREIGKALGVSALVTGSVRQADDRVRIAAQLVGTSDGYQLWSETWDRPANDIFALQDEIAGAVVRALRNGYVGDATERTGAAIDPRAYAVYLQGRYWWHQRTKNSLRRAAEAFEQAIALAPGFASAYSGLADAYAVLGFYDYLPPRDAFPRAREAATRALALDDRRADAHASIGYVALYYDWDWPAAERAFERAIVLNPAYSVAHQWYANSLVARGRFDEAVAAMQRAQEVDPLSLIASAALGWVHYYRRDFDAAVAQCRRTLDLNARFEQAHLWSGWALERAGRYPEAIAALHQAVDVSNRSAVARASLGRAYALAGDRERARRILVELERDHGDYLPSFELAKLTLALGDAPAALTWLDRALEQRSHSMVFLAVDPQLDALRGEPRFAALIRKVGLPGPP